MIVVHIAPASVVKVVLNLKTACIVILHELMFGFQVIVYHKLKFQGEIMALRIGRSRLPELLNENHYSQAEFARKLNVSEAYVSQLISGARKFSLLKAKQAAKILRCFIDDLYEWEDDSG